MQGLQGKLEKGIKKVYGMAADLQKDKIHYHPAMFK
jgi:hypothetical protein